MSTTNYTNPIDLYRQGCAILADHLGPVDSVRFLRLLDIGSGDYTAHRPPPTDHCSPGTSHPLHLPTAMPVSAARCFSKFANALSAFSV